MTFITYSNLEQKFLSGYNLLNFLVWSIIPPILIPPFDIFFIRLVWKIPSWDAGTFLGLSLILIIVLIINYSKIKNNYKFEKTFDSIFFTSIILMILSFFSIYEITIKILNTLINVPFSKGVERYPFRFMIISYFGFSILISEYWDSIISKLNKIQSILRIYINFYTVKKIFTKLLYYYTIFSTFILIISIIFSNNIKNLLKDIIYKAYKNEDYLIISSLFERKDINSLNHYLKRINEIYIQMQVSISITLILILLSYFILKKHYLLIKKEMYEFILLFTYVFSSFMWFSLFISNNLDEKYNDYNKIFFKYDVNSLRAESNVIVTPDKLIINTKNQEEILLKNVLFSDIHFIEIETNNALLKNKNNFLLIKPLNKNKIILSIKKEGFYNFSKLTIISWIIVLTVIFLRFSFEKFFKK